MEELGAIYRVLAALSSALGRAAADHQLRRSAVLTRIDLTIGSAAAWRRPLAAKTTCRHLKQSNVELLGHGVPGGPTSLEGRWGRWASPPTP
jgi:hypothetical protein